MEHVADYGGYLVVVKRDTCELPHAHMDRAWALARMGNVGTTARKTARVWSAWAHLGCGYDADTMAEVRKMHHVAYAPKAL